MAKNDIVAFFGMDGLSVVRFEHYRLVVLFVRPLLPSFGTGHTASVNGFFGLILSIGYYANITHLRFHYFNYILIKILSTIGAFLKWYRQVSTTTYVKFLKNRQWQYWNSWQDMKQVRRIVDHHRGFFYNKPEARRSVGRSKLGAVGHYGVWTPNLWA